MGRMGNPMKLQRRRCFWRQMTPVWPRVKGSSVRVLEMAPPWVQTDLLGSNNEPRAMPFKEFIEETIKVLGTDAEEVLLERAKQMRSSVGPDEGAFVTQFNDMMLQPPGIAENKAVVTATGSA